MNRWPGKAQERGFTLIEMLIALVILAVAAVTIYSRSGQAIEQLYSLEQRTIANWLAQDYLTRLRLQRRHTDEPIATGGESEQIFSSGRLWELAVDISETEHPTMKRLEVSVSLVTDNGIEDPVYRSTAFMGRY